MVTSSFQRPPPDTVSPGIKSLNYVNNVLVRMEANDRGADEELMLDGNGLSPKPPPTTSSSPRAAA